jgi:hypothetical protein
MTTSDLTTPQAIVELVQHLEIVNRDSVPVVVTHHHHENVSRLDVVDPLTFTIRIGNLNLVTVLVLDNHHVRLENLRRTVNPNSNSGPVLHAIPRI